MHIRNTIDTEEGDLGRDLGIRKITSSAKICLKVRGLTSVYSEYLLNWLLALENSHYLPSLKVFN